MNEASFVKAAAVKKLAIIQRKMSVLIKGRAAAQVIWILRSIIDVDQISAEGWHFEPPLWCTYGFTGELLNIAGNVSHNKLRIFNIPDVASNYHQHLFKQFWPLFWWHSSSIPLFADLHLSIRSKNIWCFMSRSSGLQWADTWFRCQERHIE